MRSERTGSGSERSPWLLACRRPITSGLAALTIAVPGVAALSPAAAQAAAVPLTHSLPRGVSHSDQTWGGYAITGTGPYKKITGSWNIPTMNCAHGGGDASPWIGIDGWSNGTVEQIGIDLDCINGVDSYHPWVEMYPGPSDYFKETVHAGDTMTASVSVSNGTWTLTERDTATGWTKTFKRTPQNPPQKTSAEAILEDVGSGGAPPVPDFNTVTFSSITVGGSPLASAGNVHKTTLERRNTPLSHESPLSSGTFSITWLHH
ncbi:MAG TPA: G1 family glutamic endopeptidase [Streptosporangiaceae bacterium]